MIILRRKHFAAPVAAKTQFPKPVKPKNTGITPVVNTATSSPSDIANTSRANAQQQNNLLQQNNKQQQQNNLLQQNNINNNSNIPAVVNNNNLQK